MELSVQEQLIEQLRKASRVLIAVPKALNADSFASALALRLFLRKLEKEADVVTPVAVPESLHFLPGSGDVLHELPEAESLVISVHTEHTAVDEISYQSADNKVNIYVKPKSGKFTAEDVSFSADQSPYDTLVVLNASSLEDLGVLFEQHANTLFQLPKVNIDNSAKNEFFGAINLVNINAVSVSEILTELFLAFDNHLIDEDIATCLLTGIINQTGSFQLAQTTPQAMLKASQLITLGGRQQEIVHFLYKTKSLPLLRLWGRALARLKIHDDMSCIYSMLNLSDFGKSGAGDENLRAVLKELLDNVSSYKIVGLISETLGGGVCLQVAVHKSLDAKKLAGHFGEEAKVEGSLPGQFSVVDATLKDTSLQDAENRFLQAVAELHPA